MQDNNDHPEVIIAFVFFGGVGFLSGMLVGILAF